MLEERKKKYKVLTNDEFVDAIEREDYDLIINCTLPMVRNIANKFSLTTKDAKPQYSFDELFDEYMTFGMEAIWRAAKRYKKDSKATFITYANVSVTNRCSERYLQLMSDFTYRRAGDRTAMVDVVDFSENDEYGDRNVVYPALTVEIAEPLDVVLFNKLIDTTITKERDREILRMYYGVGYEEPLTLAKIAIKVGISTERVRQIKDRVLNTLQLNNESFKQLLD